jgi:hypothetical protein
MKLDRDYMTINNFKADIDGNVIFVEWSYDWTHPQFPGTTVKSGFVTELSPPDPTIFVNIENLTKEILCDWVNAVEDERLDTIFERSILDHMTHQHKLDQCQTFYLGT